MRLDFLKIFEGHGCLLVFRFLFKETVDISLGEANHGVNGEYVGFGETIALGTSLRELFNGCGFVNFIFVRC